MSVLYRLWKSTTFGYRTVVRRTFLSESFRCEDAWKERLKSSKVLSKFKLEDLYYELDQRYEQTGRLNAVDVDIFAHGAALVGEGLDELEDLVHKFRLCDNATTILPSTHHAVVRAYIASDSYQRLLNVLDDRLNYGVFPDLYTVLLLMDTFIKSNDFRSAAKVAALQMLQEDFSDLLVTYMSLYSCHRFILDPKPWSDEPEEPDVGTGEVSDEEEEVRVRVKFIRNPFFDDHFDLKDGDSIVGKTLAMAARSLNDEFGRSYVGMGLCLYKKWGDLRSHIEQTLQGTDLTVYKDAVDFIKAFIAKQNPPKEGANEEGSLSEELKAVIISRLEELDARSLILNEPLLNVCEQRLKEVVEKNENEMAEKQKKVFEEWEHSRERLIAKVINDMNTEKRLEKVKAAKEELKQREEELFFFNIEDELDLRIDGKKQRLPKKWTGKKKKKRTDSIEYVPPEIVKRSN